MDHRKDYWNENYLHYFQERTAESNKSTINGDCAPADRLIFERYLQQTRLNRGERLLEVGLGFGRLIPSFLQRGAKVYGVDISPQMILDFLAKGGLKSMVLISHHK